jgi:fatty-acyl-CoA synthase
MQTTLLLDIAADAMGFRLCVDDWTYDELRARAKDAAALAVNLGVGQLAFCGLNGPIVPQLLFGAGYAGVPFCPINFRLPDDRLNALVARTAPSLLVVADDMAARIAAHEGVTVISVSAFNAATAANPAPDDFVSEEGDIAVLLFTSGTTGEPKAAVLRHENLTSYVMGTVEFLSAEDDDAALVSVPAYHIAGMSAILTGIYGGRRIVYMPQFKAEDWAATVNREGVTHAMVVPTMLDRILDDVAADNPALPSLRALSYGGGRMPEPVIERALAMLPHVDFVNAYGLTETSSTIALLSAEDHRAAISSEESAVRERLGSVGRPLPGLDVEIRGPDGAVLAAGQSGEIYVRGPQVSGKYLGKKLTDDDGWFATNDGGMMDDEGYLFVEGRLDDVIVRGGENLSPGEIEDCLRRHPAVEDCAVLGLPCTTWGEKIGAVVVRGGDVSDAELADHVRAELRSTKTPESWFFVDELPYNEMGKLLRRVLKEQFASEDAGC